MRREKLSKIKSRKYQVWLIWTALVAISIVITKTVSVEIVGWYGIVSIIYIGGNVAQKYLYKKEA